MNRRLLSFVSLFLVLALLSALAPSQVRPVAAQALFPPDVRTPAALVLPPVDAWASSRGMAVDVPEIQGDPDWGRMPVYFVENQGQLDEQAAYYIQGSDKPLFFTTSGVTFALLSLPDEPAVTWIGEGQQDRDSFSPVSRLPAARRGISNSDSLSRWVVKLDFLDVNPDVSLVAEEQQ